MPFDGFSQQDFAQKLIDEYEQAGIHPSDVYVQSFHLDDIQYWLKKAPEYAKQAVYLDARMYKDSSLESSAKDMKKLHKLGITYIAPPIFALVTTDPPSLLLWNSSVALALL